MTRGSNHKTRTVLKRLIDQGQTLHSWARSKGYPPSTVYAAVHGTREGVVSVRIRRELEAAISA